MTDQTDNTDNFLDEAEATVEAHQPIVDAGDAPGSEAHDRLETTTAELNQLGENLAKAAADAAYATIGAVGLVSDRVKEYYSDQLKQYAADHPDLAEEPNASHLLSRFSEQLEGFVGDVGKLFRDLVDRGRAGARTAADTAEEAAGDMAAGAADLADEVAEAADRAAQDVGDAAEDLADVVAEVGADVGQAADDLAADDLAEEAVDAGDRAADDVREAAQDAADEARDTW